MKSLWTLYRRELGSYFVSPVAYFVLFGFTLVNGLGFTLLVETFVERGIKDVMIFQVMMSWFQFWFMLLIISPLITMRTFSEEFKLGTIEMLLTAPVREWEVVLAKYLSALTFFAVLWSPLAINMAWLHTVSTEKMAISWGSLLLPYVMLLCYGMLYVAIGVFTSVLTKNQIIAAIFSFGLIFLIFFAGIAIPWINPDRTYQDLVAYFSPLDQMDTFSKGIFDTRPMVFYISGTSFFLFLTERVLQARRLKA